MTKTAPRATDIAAQAVRRHVSKGVPQMGADAVVSVRRITRVLIVEDEGLFRELLQVGLSQEKQLEVVGAFGDAETALQKAPGLCPDAALLDIELGGSMNGVRLGLELREHLPALGIVLLSNHQDPAYLAAVPATASAGWAYLRKKSVGDLPTLTRAITGVAAGLLVLDPGIVEKAATRKGSVLESLTPRQHEVLALIAQGFTNEAIADKLFLASKSVENHISQIYRQLNIDTSDPHTQPRVTAVLKYLRNTSAGPRAKPR
ncbi:MAG: LuxR C-terminal-related transcriptional regulator [Limnochordia bacterium]